MKVVIKVRKGTHHMTTRSTSTPATDLAQRLDDFLVQHHAPLAALKLAAYAADASRVLSQLDELTGLHPQLAAPIHQACPAWRDLPWGDAAVGLVATVLHDAIRALESMHAEVRQLLDTAHAASDAHAPQRGMA